MIQSLNLEAVDKADAGGLNFHTHLAAGDIRQRDILQPDIVDGVEFFDDDGFHSRRLRLATLARSIPMWPAVARRGQLTRRCWFSQNGLRSSRFSILPAPESGSGVPDMSTLRGHL